MAQSLRAFIAMSEYIWWQHGVIYQIYPRSFQDSNGDGVGDLAGIRSRLDYLQRLGVGTIWLSPIYPSPMADFGYDISNYVDVHPLFGTLAELDALIDEVHHRNMKLLLDLVPNHTSDQHPWFIESRSSRNNPKRDWYIWKEKNSEGGPPNNWRASFGGSAWEWDENTQQFYYHAFAREQPDLNWRNPEVREAMYNVMRFWLDRGVDGFRIDVLWHLIKDAQFRDNPINPDYRPYMATYDELLPIYSTDQPEVHEIVREMRKLLDGYNSRIMIGEIYLPIQKLVTYYGMDRDGAHLPFNFQLLTLNWSPQIIGGAIQQYEAALPAHAWPNWVIGNHDQPRVSSRLGSEQSRVAAVLLLTLRGTPTMYYGDEIGMRDVAIPRNEIVDPQGLNMPDRYLSRDPARTPMQWDANVNAGFTNGKPWLRLSRNYRENNVQLQQDDPKSILRLYQNLISLRNSEPALREGTYLPCYSDHQLLSFIRQAPDGAGFLIILNMTHRTALFRNNDPQLEGIISFSTSPELEGQIFHGDIVLSGDEAHVIKLRPFRSSVLV
jgi:alpha-glucosidase